MFINMFKNVIVKMWWFIFYIMNNNIIIWKNICLKFFKLRGINVRMVRYLIKFRNNRMNNIIWINIFIMFNSSIISNFFYNIMGNVCSRFKCNIINLILIKCLKMIYNFISINRSVFRIIII